MIRIAILVVVVLLLWLLGLRRVAILSERFCILGEVFAGEKGRGAGNCCWRVVCAGAQGDIGWEETSWLHMRGLNRYEECCAMNGDGKLLREII